MKEETQRMNQNVPTSNFQTGEKGFKMIPATDGPLGDTSPVAYKTESSSLLMCYICWERVSSSKALQEHCQNLFFRCDLREFKARRGGETFRQAGGVAASADLKGYL